MKPKYRVSSWLDMKRIRPVYVVEIRVRPRCWRPYYCGGPEGTFDLRYDACAYMRMLKDES